MKRSAPAGSASSSRSLSGVPSLTAPRIRAVQEISVHREAEPARRHHRQVEDALGELDGAAAALVYVPHTTAGVTINEHADPAVARDFEAALERIVAEDWPWQHIEEGEENAPTHIRARLHGPGGARPAPGRRARARHVAGHLLLRVRRPAERTVYVTTLS